VQQYEKISGKIIEIVHDRGLTTKEITKELGTESNISLLVNLMCDQGLLIRGMLKAGWKSNVYSYYLFRAYFSDIDLNEFDEASAREFMVKQYLASFGPVTENDISWWTGFPKNEIRKILGDFKDQIIQFEVPDLEGRYIMLYSDKQLLESMESPKKQNVNLLPVLDPYIMGYKDRKRYLDHKYYDFVFDFNGNATSTILLDGRVVGVWDFRGRERSM